jgi:hypothetical protein
LAPGIGIHLEKLRRAGVEFLITDLENGHQVGQPCAQLQRRNGDRRDALKACHAVSEVGPKSHVNEA